ncbi:MAG: MTH1187 family thiamine-binding protein [Chloroflexota bacterium]
MAIIEVSVVPVGTGSPSVSPFVAGAVRILKNHPEVKYELTAMGTIIEGDLDRALDVVKEMHRSAFTAGAQRVVTTIKVDERRDKPSTIASKIAAVQQRLKE